MTENHSITEAEELAKQLRKENSNLKRQLRALTERNNKYQLLIAHLINDEPAITPLEYSSILPLKKPEPNPTQPKKTTNIKTPRALRISAIEKAILAQPIADELQAHGVLETIRRIKPMPALKLAGIYFLLNPQNEIVYVGQSLDILNRISFHMCDGEKRPYFTHYKAICCPIDELNKWESFFISHLNPPLNKTTATYREQRKRENDWKSEIKKELPRKVRDFSTKTPWVHFSKVL